MEKKSLDQLHLEFDNELARWNDIYKHGWKDPNWEDGTALHTAKSNMMWAQTEIAKINPMDSYLFKKLPPDMPLDYMADKDGIIDNAIICCLKFRKNPEYQWLLTVKDSLDKKEKSQSCIEAVIGYVTGLDQSIINEDYLNMRRYKYVNYEESFTRCKKTIEAMIKKKEAIIPDFSGQLCFSL